jgi:psiF repeat
MTLTHFLATCCVAILLASGAAFAQTPAAGAKSTTTAAPKARTAKSLACSKEADEKNIHSKARKKFMSQCKKG